MKIHHVNRANFTQQIVQGYDQKTFSEIFYTYDRKLCLDTPVVPQPRTRKNDICSPRAVGPSA